jgi:DNA-binding NtrC family response regulator
MRILIVDDDVGTLNALSVGLTSLGHRVIMAKGGRQALAILETLGEGNDEVEFLITDLRMPDMNGLELIRSARELMPELSTILITAYGGAHVETEVMKLDHCGYVEKPFNPETLLKKIYEIRPVA